MTVGADDQRQGCMAHGACRRDRMVRQQLGAVGESAGPASARSRRCAAVGARPPGVPRCGSSLSSAGATPRSATNRCACSARVSGRRSTAGAGDCDGAAEQSLGRGWPATPAPTSHLPTPRTPSPEVGVTAERGDVVAHPPSAAIWSRRHRLSSKPSPREPSSNPPNTLIRYVTLTTTTLLLVASRGICQYSWN